MGLIVEQGEMGHVLVVECDFCDGKITSSAAGQWGCDTAQERRPVFVHVGCREDFEDAYPGEWVWFPGGLDYFPVAFASQIQLNWSRTMAVFMAVGAFGGIVNEGPIRPGARGLIPMPGLTPGPTPGPTVGPEAQEDATEG